MAKRRVLIIVGAVLALLVVAGGGLWFWQSKDDKKPVAKVQEETSQEVSPSGLSVGGGGTSLGQLNTKQGAGSAADNSPNPTLVDPSTFAQYDKYKNADQGLFAEIKPGDGAELAPGKQAAIYYKGWLTNGQMFDQSRASSDGSLQPLMFALGGHNVIAGLEQAVAGMKVGGTRLVIVPPAVGYGAQGQGPIPGNAVLVFQVKLLQAQ